MTMHAYVVHPLKISKLLYQISLIQARLTFKAHVVYFFFFFRIFPRKFQKFLKTFADQGIVPQYDPHAKTE